MLDWIRSLNPRLPRSVQMLQLGGLASAFGNGTVLPFTLLYLHNVRGISLTVAGLIAGTLAFVGLVAGPISGTLIDRHGGRRVLALALVLLALGYGSFALVEEAWQGFLVASVAGIGNGFFWPAQSTLLAALTPPEKRPATWSMQRVVMNLGVGLGALVGGLIASTDSPGSFQVIFVLDAVTFLVYIAVLYAFVPEPDMGPTHERPGRYADVLRHGAFMAVIALNTLFVFAGMSGFELLPVYAKNEAAVTETAIGLVFFVNTVVIVLAQLPVTKLSEGRRRMRTFALLGVVWAACWLVVPLVGANASGAAAAAAFAGVMAVFGIGECLHGAVQGPLVADLAEPRLLGRYMALSALSWQLGFALGPAIGAFVLDRSPSGVWIGAAALCLVGSAFSVVLEQRIPQGLRRTPAPEGAAA